jgi:diamine N-acetyltransferase
MTQYQNSPRYAFAKFHHLMDNIKWGGYPWPLQTSSPVHLQDCEVSMIFGKRVRLRGIEREDLPRFVRWLNDPEVLQGLMLVAPLSLAQEERWFQSTLERPVEEQPLVIDAGQGSDWIPIGNIAFQHIDWKNRLAEVGIFIGEKRFWNQGFGSEAMRLLLRYGFHTLNLNRIFLRVYETNLRAIHSYEKAGFVLEGRLRQGHFLEGNFIDVLMMSVLSSEYRD